MIFPLTKKIAEILWAETGDLQPVGDAGAGELATVRERLARLVVDVGVSEFPNAEALPVSPAGGGTDQGGELLELVETLGDKGVGSIQAPYLLVWPGKGAKDVATGPLTPPHGWDTRIIEDGVGPFHSTSRPDLGALYVYSAPRGELAGNAPALTSCVTGGLLPVGTAGLTPAAAKVSPKVRRSALILAAIALLLFAFTSIWTVKLGNASRATYENFAGLPGTSSVAGDPGEVAKKTASCLAVATADTSQPLETLRRLPAEWHVKREDIWKQAAHPPSAGAAHGQVRQLPKKPHERMDCTGLWLLAASSSARGVAVVDGSELGRWDALWARLTHSWSIYGARVSLVKPMLAAMLAIVLLTVSAGLAVKGRMLGILIDKRNRFSLARTQMILWTFVLLGSYLVFSLFNIGFLADDIRALSQLAGMQDVQDEATGAFRLEGLGAMLENISIFPTMRAELWAVLGLVVGTPLLSHALLEKGVASTGPVTNKALDTKAIPALARFSDLFLGEEVKSRSEISISRIQHLVVTALLISTYFNLLLTFARSIDALSVIRGAQAVTPLFPSMPDVDATFVALLTLSHGTYLVVKGASMPASREGSGSNSANN